MTKVDRYLCFVVLLVCSAICGKSVQAESEMSYVFSQAGSTVELRSSIVLPVDRCVAYAMLTDYEQLNQFIPDLLESRSERLSNDKVKVWQVGEVHVLIFHVKMKTVLEMTETLNERIVFQQLEGDLQAYSGEWRFSEIPEGTQLTYEAKMTFKPTVPMFIARTALEHDVRQKFIAIRDEASARKSRQMLACTRNPAPVP